MAPPSPTDFPVVRTAGLNGMLVSFADALSEPANRAALAFRAALELAAWEGVGETSTSLASTFLRFDPLTLPHDDLRVWLQALLDSRNWYDEPMPPGRKLWRVPCVYGTHLAPQLTEAAAAAGLSESDAIDRISNTKVRVLTIGFAPGQPYLGPLGAEWNLPRQKDLTPMVPAGALVLAISQLVLFTAPAPTGWRHVGQTAFRCFQSDRPAPFALTPGDEVMFDPASVQDLERIKQQDPHGLGGACFERIDA